MAGHFIPPFTRLQKVCYTLLAPLYLVALFAAGLLAGICASCYLAYTLVVFIWRGDGTWT